jgi:hypothetical protein
MDIRITMTVDDELADPEHAMGVTEAGFEAIVAALVPLGTNIDVARYEL